MPEVDITEEKKKEKPKGPLGKLKENLLPDQEEQAAIISTFVRLGVLVWSGGILTLNYVAIPGLPQQKIVFSLGCWLASEFRQLLRRVMVR